MSKCPGCFLVPHQPCLSFCHFHHFLYTLYIMPPPSLPPSLTASPFPSYVPFSALARSLTCKLLYDGCPSFTSLTVCLSFSLYRVCVPNGTRFSLHLLSIPRSSPLFSPFCVPCCFFPSPASSVLMTDLHVESIGRGR